jgi:CRISPR-associated exonuclease Cas4
VVAFDDALRGLTEETSLALHELIASRKTPPAVYEKRKCDSCSLIELCQPHAFRLKRGAAAWFGAALEADHQTAFTGESEA